MDTKEYIDSGILELYVYGLLSESENLEVSEMAKKHPEVNNEIISIEKAIVALSSSFSPFHSVANFEKIKAKLDLKYGKVIEMKPTNNWFKYSGWAAAIALLIGIGFQYQQLDSTNNQVVTITNEKEKLNQDLNTLELKKQAIESSLNVVRDINNTVVALGGQVVSPKSFAKVYWNKDTKAAYVDASGLPTPPKGMVYQVWALKLSPLTPTSIGLLKDFNQNDQKIFEVEDTGYAEAFGITLEPEGGSVTPTMEQLYALGKV